MSNGIPTLFEGYERFAESLYPGMMVVSFKNIHCNYYKKRKGKRYVRYCNTSGGVTPNYIKQFNEIVERRIEVLKGA